MRIPLLSAAPPPDDALGWLSACHVRMEHFLSILERLPAHLSARGPDDEARAAVHAVRRYFNEAAPLHHADEEEDVYPALRAVAAQPPEVLLALLAMLDAVTQEHAPLDDAWQALQAPLDAALAGAGLSPSTVAAFVVPCRAHLHREETHILPVARRWLDADTRRRLAAAMTRRRAASREGPPDPEEMLAATASQERV